MTYVCTVQYKVEASYDFEPQEKGDLRLCKGDIITVFEKSTQHWWKGSCNGQEGLFEVVCVEGAMWPILNLSLSLSGFCRVCKGKRIHKSYCCAQCIYIVG